MRKSQSNSRHHEIVSVRKLNFSMSALALACLGLFCSEAYADDELLQFERISPEKTRTVVAPRKSADGDVEKIAAQLIEAQRASSAQLIQSVRQSLAPLPMAKQDVPALQFEKVDDLAGPLQAKRYVPELGTTRLDTAVAPIVVPGLIESTPLDRTLPASVLTPSGQSMPSERQLREIFLRVVEAAAGRSPTVARALAERSASEADVSAAKGQRYPQVDIGARSHSVEFGSGGSRSASDPSLSLDITTPIFDWGRISKTIQSRSELANAADWAFEAELESSAFDVTSNMVELGKQRIIVDISQQYVNRMSDLVKMLEGIVAVDGGRVSELTQARARLLQAEASRSTADTRARDIEISLRRMVGDRPLPTLPTSTYWDIRLPELQWLLAEAVSHPVIRQAQAQASSADLQADVVRSSALPQVNWVVGKVTGQDSSGREPAWQTGLSLSWGAFRGGSARASERAARQRAEAGWKVAEQQALDLEYRIRAANEDARALVDRAELYRALTVETNKVREAFYEQWYHLGRRTLLDVLSSESEHYNNQVGEVSSRFDGYQAVMRQYASAGTLVRWLSVGKS
ncbi:TolC family protein [Stenotrophomonas sp. Iso1]|uniref:TolC family protein n=1 Tax=Stenotrophomonas sp. Iso1 TaxID=2977283 RepID=UPI0022B7B4EF|nr:TolC family protein [Stenotrophomonas sp. Iso1]